MKHQQVKQGKFFKLDGEILKRQRRYCPRCGEGTFLAEHKDRVSCGSCHYAEFKKK